MLIPRRDLEFQLYEMLDTAGLCRHPRFDMHDREIFDGAIDAARRIAQERFLPYAAASDVEEPRLEAGKVRLIPETRAALQAYYEAGFGSTSFDAAVGGLQLPATIAQACGALFAGAHIGFHAYALLTAGAARLVTRFGTPEQRRLYADPMIAGRFFGTMCLSETQAGSSLADIRTLAVPQADGSYLVRGSKMWISGGDHDLAENIVHLVLARVPDAPPGVKGISLFIVPRHRVAADGTLGAANDVRCAGLNHKMGWRGTVNTVLAFGEDGSCRGELLGTLHGGLGHMFQMMNEARIGVGVGAVALGYAGYQHSLAYARERLQGRPLDDRDPNSPPVPIIRHADVRRMLLAQKAWVEGGLALVLYCARLIDDIATSDDDAGRKQLEGLLELLTPVAKSWPAEFCLEANKYAIQVLGGYGYTRDYPVERLYRDNRLNHIHEGAHGIQGLDLLGRKVRLHGGAALRELGRRIRESVALVADVPPLAGLARALAETTADLEHTTMALLSAAGSGKVALSLANATLYLEALGQVVVAWRWLDMARVARRALDASAADHDFYAGKLAACRYFFRYELPRTVVSLELLRSLDDTTLAIGDDQF